MDFGGFWRAVLKLSKNHLQDVDWLCACRGITTEQRQKKIITQELKRGDQWLVPQAVRSHVRHGQP
jgi:hypothetical protein